MSAFTQRISGAASAVCTFFIYFYRILCCRL